MESDGGNIKTSFTAFHVIALHIGDQVQSKVEIRVHVDKSGEFSLKR